MLHRPLTFPILVPPARPRRQVDSFIRETPDFTADPDEFLRPKPKVLCVDDDQTVLLYTQVLLGARFDISIAESGPAGLVQMASLRPDWVVVDYQMPGMDGPGFLRAAKAAGLHAQFILLTGLSAGNLDWEGLSPLGLKGHLSKPLDGDRLAGIIAGRE